MFIQYPLITNYYSTSEMNQLLTSMSGGLVLYIDQQDTADRVFAVQQDLTTSGSVIAYINSVSGVLASYVDTQYGQLYQQLITTSGNIIQYVDYQLLTTSGNIIQYVDYQLLTTSGDIVSQIPIATGVPQLTGSGVLTSSGTPIYHNTNNANHFVSIIPLTTDNDTAAKVGEVYAQLGLNTDTIYTTGQTEAAGIAFQWLITASGNNVLLNGGQTEGDYLRLDGSTELTGHLLPTMVGASGTVSVVDIGTSTQKFNNVYAHHVWVDSGSLYVNGKKVIEDVADTIVVRTDPDQDLMIKTTSTGDIKLISENEVLNQGQGGVSLTVPSTQTFKNLVLTNSSQGGTLGISAAGVNCDLGFIAYGDIDFIAESFTVDADVTITGTLSTQSIKIAGGATEGAYLRGNGSGFVSSSIQEADLPATIINNNSITTISGDIINQIPTCVQCSGDYLQTSGVITPIIQTGRSSYTASVYPNWLTGNAKVDGSVVIDNYGSTSFTVSGGGPNIIWSEELLANWDFSSSGGWSLSGGAVWGEETKELWFYNGVISTVSVVNGGTGYSVNDVLTVSDGTAGTVTVSSADAGVVTGVTLTTSGYGYSVATHNTTGGGGSGCTINVLTLQQAQISQATTFEVGAIYKLSTTFGTSVGPGHIYPYSAGGWTANAYLYAVGYKADYFYASVASSNVIYKSLSSSTISHIHKITSISLRKVITPYGNILELKGVDGQNIFNIVTGSGSFGNVFVGPAAGQNAIEVRDCVFLGANAGTRLLSNDTSSMGGAEGGCVAIGTNALATKVMGYGSTVVGHSAGRYADGSSSNFSTLIGYRAGGGESASLYNSTCLGAEAGYNAASTTSLFLGRRAGYGVTRSDSLYIETSYAMNTPLIYGEFDTDRVVINGGSTQANAKLSVYDNSTAADYVINVFQDNASNTATVARVRGDGTGDLLNIFDGSTEVFSVIDGGNVGINNPSPTTTLSVSGAITLCPTTEPATPIDGHAVFWTTLSGTTTTVNIKLPDGNNIVLATCTT